MKLSIVLIVKNEEKILDKCLASVKEADEAVFVDTGSTDDTIKIAKKYTNKIYHFKWCNDFSKARNFAKDKCTGDWIYSIDADHELLTPISKVKEIISKAKVRALSIKSISKSGWHWRKVIWKNDKDIFWVGKVHENLNTTENENVNIERRCGYSDNHKLDTKRNLKILLTMEQTPRTLFYLAKEYYDLKQFKKAVEYFNKYLKVSTWVSEKAEAYYYRASSLWKLQMGDKARESIYRAIQANPDMKKALILASTMHYEPWKSKWKAIADRATNKDVLFVL